MFRRISITGTFLCLVGLSIVSAVQAFPLGLPPTAPDPILAASAPDECLAYISWAGSAKADAASTNRAERILADAEINMAIEGAIKIIEQAIPKYAVAEAGEEIGEMAKTFVPLTRMMLERPTAIYVSKVEMGPNGPSPLAGIIVKLGDGAIIAKTALVALQKQLPPDAVTEVKVAGLTSYKIQPPAPGAPALTWTVKGSYLMAGIGEGELARLLAIEPGATPAWLAAVRKDLGIARPSFVAYVNAVKSVELAKTMGMDPGELAGATGLNVLESVAYGNGFGKDDFESILSVSIKAEAGGVFKLADAEPLTVADVANIPADSLVSFAGRLSLAKVLEIATEITPEAPQLVEAGEDEFGLDIKDDLVKGLGDRWVGYWSPTEQGLIPYGVVLSVTVADRARVESLLNKIVEFSKKMAPPNMKLQLRNTQVNGKTITSLTGVPVVLPSWHLSDNELTISTYVQSVRARLTQSPDMPQLSQQPEVAQRLTGEKSLALITVDSAQWFEAGYPVLSALAAVGGQAIEQELRNQDLDVDVLPLIPSMAIGRHLRPSTFSVRRTASSVQFVSHQNFPVPSALPSLLSSFAGAGTYASEKRAVAFPDEEFPFEDEPQFKDRFEEDGFEEKEFEGRDSKGALPTEPRGFDTPDFEK